MTNDRNSSDDLPRDREEAIRRAGVAQAAAIERLLHRDPAEAARAAHVAGGPPVADLEARIRAWQAEQLGPTDTSSPTG